MTALRRRGEIERCRRRFPYFVNTYCHVETKDDGAGEWAPFHLWPAQIDVAHAMQAERRLVILKARQLGLTWLCVAFALWLMLFHPIATVLLFSLRDEEAKKLLKRLRGMHARLPQWMQQPVKVKGRIDTQHELEFANGSTAQALTKAGDSYTASLVVVDEADLIPHLGDLLDSLKPTIADGGRMILVSKAEKSQAESPFKRIYRAARSGKTEWRHIFLPWNARPGRTNEWYEAEKQAYQEANGSLSGFRSNYPSTDEEALSAAEGLEWPSEFFDNIYFDQWPSELICRVVSLDPSKGKKDRSGDYSAFVKLGVDAEWNLWVDADLDNGRPVEGAGKSIIEDGLVICREWLTGFNGPRGFVVETNGFQEMVALAFQRVSQARGLHMPLYTICNKLPKAQRIRTLGTYLAQKRLRVKNSPGGRMLVGQLRDFSGREVSGIADDGPDALQMSEVLADFLLNGSGDVELLRA